MDGDFYGRDRARSDKLGECGELQEVQIVHDVHPMAPARTLATNRASASLTSSGASSCRKWAPLTITVSWFGQARQNSRWAPIRKPAGSASMKSFGIGRGEPLRKTPDDRGPIGRFAGDRQISRPGEHRHARWAGIAIVAPVNFDGLLGDEAQRGAV